MVSIGGFGDSEWLHSVERVDTKQIAQNEWEYIESLSVAAGMTRAVIYDDMIWVIGGMANIGDGPYYLDTIHAIDAQKGTVKLLEDTLPYQAFDVAAVVVNHKIYAFGGFNGNYVDSWMRYVGSV